MAGGVRAARGGAHNTVNRRRLKIFFQRFPGVSSHSGISDLDFTIRVGAAPPVAGRTASDGKVEVLLGPGDTATLEILGSQYQVSQLPGSLHPIEELRGVQQRLNMLGYGAGELESGAPPVQARTSFNQSKATEHAIIDLQSDHNPLMIDAVAGPQTRGRLNQVIQNAGGG